MLHKINIVWILALIFAVITGYLNVTATENLPSLVCLLVFPFILSWTRDKKVWLWGLIIGLSVMGSQFFALAINYRVVDAPRYPVTLAILVLPALVSAYAGTWLRHWLRPSPYTS